AAGSGGQAPQPSARKNFPDQRRASCRSSRETAPNAESEVGCEQGTTATKAPDAADACVSQRCLDSLVPATFNRLKHDPEKWKPVFPRDKRGTAFARRSCSNKEMGSCCDSTQSHHDLTAASATFPIAFSERRFRCWRFQRCRNPAGPRFPEGFGAVEAPIGLSRPVAQFLDLRLLITDDQSRGKCAVAALLLRQAFRAIGDDVRKQGLVRDDVLHPAKRILQFQQGGLYLLAFFCRLLAAVNAGEEVHRVAGFFHLDAEPVQLLRVQLADPSSPPSDLLAAMRELFGRIGIDRHFAVGAFQGVVRARPGACLDPFGGIKDKRTKSS